jgi:SAM-dependent methyltransferase
MRTGRFPPHGAQQVSASSARGRGFQRPGLALARERVPDARFYRADFATSEPFPAELQAFATHVVCSEVLEHLDDPAVVLRKAVSLLAPGGRLIVTVPGGPRSAFDVHIGHRRHYSPGALEELVCRAGYVPMEVLGAGFPFFNLYKIFTVLRGDGLVHELDRAGGLSTQRGSPFRHSTGCSV